MAEFGIATGVR